MPKPTTTERRPLMTGLLGVNAAGVAAAERVVDIPVTAIRSNPDQPRKDFPPESLLELGQSIKDKGLQQPIIVRAVAQPAAPGGADAGPAYELIMGERRLRASQAVGLKTIRAIVREIQDHDMLRLAIVENVHRENLSLLDRAAAFCIFSERYHNSKVDPAAADLKISRRTGYNYSKIGSADPRFKELIAKNDLDVRGSLFLIGTRDRVAKEQPDKLEAFDAAVTAAPIGFASLKELHDRHFPEDVKTREAAAEKADARTHAAVPAPDKAHGPFWKTETELRLDLRLPREAGEASKAELRSAAAAAEKFFRAAGCRNVKIS